MNKALRVPKWAYIAGLVGLLVVGTGLLIVTLISQAAKKLFIDNRDISFDVRGDLMRLYDKLIRHCEQKVRNCLDSCPRPKPRSKGRCNIAPAATWQCLVEPIY